MGSSVYTADTIDKIAGWLRDGYSASRIAGLLSTTLGRPLSRNAIVGIVHRDERLSAIGLARKHTVRQSVPRSNTWTADQIEAACRMWRRGATAREIAMTLGWSTGAVKTFMGEHRESFPVRRDGHAASGSAGGLATRRLHGGRSVNSANDLHPPVTQSARAYDAASRRLPLADLGWRDCRFAVNDAGPGEQHLFCGLPAEPDSSWCRHHRLRCTGDGTRGERDAGIALMRGRAA